MPNAKKNSEEKLSPAKDNKEDAEELTVIPVWPTPGAIHALSVSMGEKEWNMKTSEILRDLARRKQELPSVRRDKKPLRFD